MSDIELINRVVDLSCAIDSALPTQDFPLWSGLHSKRLAESLDDAGFRRVVADDETLELIGSIIERHTGFQQAGWYPMIHEILAALRGDTATGLAPSQPHAKSEPDSVAPFVATVHRPGLPDVHLGFAFRHQAEHAAWSLTDDLHNTQHVEGTTITWSPTPDGVSPLAPVPAHPCALADLIAQEDNNQPTGHAFPDLFSRLKAQEGYETAARIWTNACSWLDRNEIEATSVSNSKPTEKPS